jgi:hypothetical protein
MLARLCTNLCASPLSHSSLMMEAVRTSETSVDNHFTRQYIPEDNSEHPLSPIFPQVSNLQGYMMFTITPCCIRLTTLHSQTGKSWSRLLLNLTFTNWIVGQLCEYYNWQSVSSHGILQRNTKFRAWKYEGSIQWKVDTSLCRFLLILFSEVISCSLHVAVSNILSCDNR